MRNRFDQQLNTMHVELIKMGALCETAISSATKALLESDDKLRQAVMQADQEIDQKERDIEALCLKLLLQQQPVARDLREISSALKMISDMERIGDQASDIAEITRDISHTELIDQVPIADMARATVRMVTQSVDAFVARDFDLAHQVVEQDDQVDELFRNIRDQLITLISHGESGETCLDILMIAKYFERIGDHAVNIAGWVMFSLTGQHKD